MWNDFIYSLNILSTSWKFSFSKQITLNIFNIHWGTFFTESIWKQSCLVSFLKLLRYVDASLIRIELISNLFFSEHFFYSSSVCALKNSVCFRGKLNESFESHQSSSLNLFLPFHQENKNGYTESCCKFQDNDFSEILN